MRSKVELGRARWVLLTCVLALGCLPERDPASLVVVGARVWTGAREEPWAEAVASRGDRIVAVGDRAEIEAWIGDATEVVEAEGRFLVPGFIDSHLHLLAGGSALASVQLRDAATPGEFAERIGSFAATRPVDEWILGGAWDHTQWGASFPHDVGSTR